MDALFYDPRASRDDIMTPRTSGRLALAALIAFSASFTVSAAPLPRIKARSASPAGEFYTASTNARFVPHGYNYIKLADIATCTQQHATFNVNLYNASAAESFLAQMQYDGYNVVRVFINPGDDYYGANCQQSTGKYGIAGPKNSTSLYAPYIANFADFVSRAKARGIYVIPVLSFVPQNAKYIGIANANTLPNIEDLNAYFMSPGLVQAKATYARDFAQALSAYSGGELLSAIFAWELENEVFVLWQKKPFSLTSGLVQTADTLSYDMAIPAQRQQAVDANVVNWANQSAAAIRQVDPQAMVAASVFTFAAVGRTGADGVQPGGNPDLPYYPARPISLRLYSTLDYTDIHTYPLGSTYTLSGDLNTSEFAAMNKTTRPFLMGEFGAFKSQYPSIVPAANAMRAHRDSAYAMGFAGSLFWTWDTLVQSHMWHGSEQSGAINGVLAFPKY